MNLPNKLTLGRLLLTFVFFVLLAMAEPLKDGAEFNTLMLTLSLVVFIVAALTDLADGWLARRYGMVTDFGRVADPFADKILVCGGLVFLLSIGPELSRVHDWMVVIIIAREFLVSSMRGLAESKGIPFGANYWGKMKTLSQNTAIASSIIYLAVQSGGEPAWLRLTVDIILYIATALTALSGLVYVYRAKKVLSLDT